MDRHDMTKLVWETPSTVALTDTDSRADQPDVAIRNIVSSGGA
jgi:hypothetical protein